MHWLIVALYYCIQQTGLSHFPPLLSSSPWELTLSPLDVTLTPYNGNENLRLLLPPWELPFGSSDGEFVFAFYFYPCFFHGAFINLIFILSVVLSFLSHSLKRMRTCGQHSLLKNCLNKAAKVSLFCFLFFSWSSLIFSLRPFQFNSILSMVSLFPFHSLKAMRTQGCNDPLKNCL